MFSGAHERHTYIHTYIHKQEEYYLSFYTEHQCVKKQIDKVSYKWKLIRVQRLINIRTAKAYSTVLNEALCIITGLTPIDLKIEEAFQFCKLTRGSKQDEALVDCDMELKYWHHPAETIN